MERLPNYKIILIEINGNLNFTNRKASFFFCLLLFLYPLLINFVVHIFSFGGLERQKIIPKDAVLVVKCEMLHELKPSCPHFKM